MRYLIAALALGFASPAMAAVHPYTVIWNPQSTALPVWTTATIKQDFSNPVGANGSNYIPQTVPGLFQETVKIQGTNQRVDLFNVPLSGMDGQYIGVINGAEYYIDLLAPKGAKFFSFAFNNLGTNDKLRLDYADGTSQEFTGFDMLNGASIIGGQNGHDIPDQPDNWGRVSYDMGGNNPITKASFMSGSGTWYIDSIAWAAPEPAAWLMMILGFGFAGSQIRRRRRPLAAI